MRTTVLAILFLAVLGIILYNGMTQRNVNTTMYVQDHQQAQTAAEPQIDMPAVEQATLVPTSQPIVITEGDVKFKRMAKACVDAKLYGAPNLDSTLPNATVLKGYSLPVVQQFGDWYTLPAAFAKMVYKQEQVFVLASDFSDAQTGECK